MQGNLEQNHDRGMLRSSHQDPAVVAFERSLELARRSQMTALALNVHLDLAYSESRGGDLRRLAARGRNAGARVR